MASYPEVNAYARAMAFELDKRENSDKGDWTEMPVAQAVAETFYHVAKLHKAVEHLQESLTDLDAVDVGSARKAVLEFAADVGNYAMIVADVCQALGHTEADLDDAEAVANASFGSYRQQPASYSVREIGLFQAAIIEWEEQHEARALAERLQVHGADRDAT